MLPTVALQALDVLLRDNPNPAPNAVAESARVAVRELDGWLRQMQAAAGRDSQARPVSAVRTRELLAAAVAEATSEGSTSWDWDQATQNYLAIESLAAGQRGREFRERLLKARQVLRFPDGYDAPRNFTAAAYRAAMRDVQDALNQIGGRP
jgi:hypothetical protein